METFVLISYTQPNGDVGVTAVEWNDFHEEDVNDVPQPEYFICGGCTDIKVAGEIQITGDIDLVPSVFMMKD